MQPFEPKIKTDEPSLPSPPQTRRCTPPATAALLSLHRHQRSLALLSLRRNILHALLHLPVGIGGAASPPAILILGFRGHGKSAFINTACRALAGEEGPLILRSETSPVGFPPAKAMRLAVSVAAAAGCSCGGWVEKVGEAEMVVEVIDAPPSAPPSAETAVVMIAAAETVSPECVVLVMRCSRQERERRLAVRRLTEMAGELRNRGLPLLVVLTHKRSLGYCKQEELKLEVAFSARTDCVYFIENYTAESSTKCGGLTVVKNDFDTHHTALAIIRQCIEFVAQRRRQSSLKKIDLATKFDEKNEEDVIDSKRS
ncbi:uncharacterized protein LOC110019667 [Phalaenopsis equestris]|uniref:uncharacterized protein LOC110019667 n=1 Tax=Phalaenopsis equestris TaxID=78828 RepID=UPI0009E43F16|nr:uncharacterized protein LOC110019667 [Phalaenopsis equestris]